MTIYQNRFQILSDQVDDSNAEKVKLVANSVVRGQLRILC